MKQLKLMTLSFAATMMLWSITAQGSESIRAAEQFTVDRTDLAHIGNSWIESIDLLFNVGPGGFLSLGTSEGSVDVRTWSQDKVRVIITKRATASSEFDAKRFFEMFRVRALHGGKDLKVLARAGSSECANAVGVKYTIWVPRSYNLDIKTESGSIELPELNGKFSAHTGEGTITVDCDTENLDIEVDDSAQSEDAAFEEDPVEEVRPSNQEQTDSDASSRN